MSGRRPSTTARAAARSTPGPGSETPMAGLRRGRTLRPRIPTLAPNLAVGIGVVVALGGLNRVLDGGIWWLLASVVAALVLVAIGTVRYGTRRPLLPTAAGAVALSVVLTL